ncbi:hypothetical protein PENTCL1PPCAC_22145, partial [Pristionchus entomophagus]
SGKMNTVLERAWIRFPPCSLTHNSTRHLSTALFRTRPFKYFYLEGCDSTTAQFLSGRIMGVDGSIFAAPQVDVSLLRISFKNAEVYVHSSKNKLVIFKIVSSGTFMFASNRKESHSHPKICIAFASKIINAPVYGQRVPVK